MNKNFYKKILAIIPARAGSKGIKNKNLLLLGKIPLLCWPINAAKKSKYIDKIIVSTDSRKILKIAKKFGAKTPFLRPKKFSQDKSSSFQVIKHCLEFEKKNGNIYDYIFLLEPTSPFTTTSDINLAIKVLLKNSLVADSLVSISEAVNTNVNYIYKIKKKKFVEPIIKNNHHIRRQDVKKNYFLDGSFYIAKVSFYLKNKSFIGKKTIGIITNKVKSLEIDDKIDLNFARLIVEKKLNK